MAVPRLFSSQAVELESFGLPAAQPAATSKTHRLDQGNGFQLPVVKASQYVKSSVRGCLFLGKPSIRSYNAFHIGKSPARAKSNATLTSSSQSSGLWSIC
jgi:hypothetical protein